MTGTLIDLKGALIAAGPALGTFVLLSTIHAYAQRGMPEINVPPRFKIGSRKIKPLTTIPLDLLVAVVALPAGLAQHSQVKLLIGLGALTYYIAGMLQILVRIPRESLLYEMELRSMLAARIRNPNHIAEISDAFKSNVESVCPNLPAWQKRRIEKRVGETAIPRWTTDVTAHGNAGVNYGTTRLTEDDGLSKAQQDAVKTIFDLVDGAKLDSLERYKELLEHLRRCRTTDGPPFPEVERVFLRKLNQMLLTMSIEDSNKATEMLALYQKQTRPSKASESGADP